MPTGADLYIGDQDRAEWLGSYMYDGEPWFLAKEIVLARGVQEYREAVSNHLVQRNDATLSYQGWPWPWNSSRTTDYAYTWKDGALWGSNFGKPWFAVDPSDRFGGADVRKDTPDLHLRAKGYTPTHGGWPELPDMKNRQNMTRI
jgi:hypothetical protein